MGKNQSKPKPKGNASTVSKERRNSTGDIKIATKDSPKPAQIVLYDHLDDRETSPKMATMKIAFSRLDISVR